jgi:hypothetical protein
LPFLSMWHLALFAYVAPSLLVPTWIGTWNNQNTPVIFFFLPSIFLPGSYPCHGGLPPSREDADHGRRWPNHDTQRHRKPRRPAFSRGPAGHEGRDARDGLPPGSTSHGEGTTSIGRAGRTDHRDHIGHGLCGGGDHERALKPWGDAGGHWIWALRPWGAAPSMARGPSSLGRARRRQEMGGSQT